MLATSSFIISEADTNVDANSLLSELDKGLRSNKIGEQSEAIVRFPWLFERYPFPILINSACLKLAEVFRNGNNFLRVLILKVMQQSEKHLDKIVNVDEFVRRLFAVTFSNDPLARAITLRSFASLARVVAHHKNLHHLIRNSLDAIDEHESDAAIEATICFASNSNEFASNIYPKVISMFNMTNISLETKINLLMVLHHVNFNTEVSAAVREHCVNFLPTYHSEKLISSCLHTLTLVASTSLTQISDQIQLLINYFNKSSDNIKLSVLGDLKYLAQTSPHLWQKENITSLIDSVFESVLHNNYDSSYLCNVLSVITTLVDSPCILAGHPQYFNEIRNKIGKFCLRITYNEQNIELVSISINILTNLSLNYDQTNIKLDIDIVQETICAIQAFLLMSINEKSLEINDKALNRIFKCIVSLCHSNQSKSSIDQIVETLRFIINNSSVNSNWFGFACESLCAIGSPTIQRNDLLSIIKKSNCKNHVDVNEDNLVKLYTLYFQISISSKIDDEETNILLSNLESASLWCCFKIIRQSMRYGHHIVAAGLLDQLKNRELFENINFWINSLSCFSIAESHLLRNENDENIDQSLNICISEYIQGMTNLKASVTPDNQLKFQCEYAKLRLKYLRTHQMFSQCCKLIRTSPPPNAAASSALSSRDDLLKCGNIVVMMRKSAKEYRLLAESYSALYQSSFNADNHTLAHIQLLQHSCVILAEAIESLVQSNRINSFFVSKDNPFQGNSNVSSFHAPLEHQNLIETCSKISKTLQTELITQNQQCKETIGGKQIGLLQSVSSDLLKVPLCIPRFFFQSIQNTCIKLAISPQPKSPGETLIINTNVNFALRVEGIVINSGSKIIRKVRKILLSVTTNLISRTSSQFNNNDNIPLKPGYNDLSLQTIVVPYNDYFQSQFLLSLTNPGLYSINIETSIIDKNEAQWKSGPHISLSAKVIEEPSLGK